MRIGVMLRTMDEKQGIGIYTHNLMDHLLPLDTGNDYVLFYRNPKFLGRYSHLDNVVEKVVHAPSKAIWDQVKIPMAARREGVDVIFHTKFTVPFFTRRKTSMALHGSAWFVHPKWYKTLDRNYISATMRLYCRKADLIISNSNLTTNDYVSLLGVPREKIRTIHLAFDSRFRRTEDTAFLDRVRAKYELPDKFILYVGRIDPGKNFGSLVEAFDGVHKEIPHRIVVAGHPRWGYQEEFATIRDLGLEDKILFKDWVPQEELVAFYNLADLFVFPSPYEGFGIPLLEAMACGCPTIASNSGALPEIAGGASLLVNPHDGDEIAEAIRQVLGQGTLRAQLLNSGLQRASEFSWRKCAKETVAAFESLNGGGR